MNPIQRMNQIRKLLRMANGPDPQDHLDDERWEELVTELDALESKMEDYFEMKAELQRERSYE